ncbi:MAG TPA: penicillin-binding protein activator [Candidatus Nitrosopolaris sp.]|nr:penicillin-binding protein activator [Candidatus Nitrosopolaris sp.]
MLWLSADIIWAIYQLVLDVVPPIPSAADYLWLGAYGFLGYYLFMTYLEFHKKFNFGKKALIASVIGNAIFLGYIIALTVNLSVLSSSRGIEMFAVIVAYPILDATLMIPAIVILVEFRKEPVWFIPWVCESLGIFLIAISDSWFALIVLTSLVEQLWLSALFFAAHFLVMAAGLLWYIKLLMPSATTREVHHPEVLTTTVHKNFTETRATKRRVPITVIAVAALASIILGILVYFSSPLALFANKNSEVIVPANSIGKQSITLGALLPLSGASSSLGESEDAAIKIAIKDVNEYFSKRNSDTRVGLIVEDTQTNPAISLEKLQDLAAKGVRIVIGPGTSAEIQQVKDYADKNGILLVSPSSTAPSLAVPGDNIFRFVPDDTHQAQAISNKMWKDGVRVVVPMWRTDVYGNDLLNATKYNFQMLGGKVVDGVGYVPRTGDFSASLNRINFMIWDQDLRALSFKISPAIAQYGADKVGIYLVSFDEVVPIFIEAQNQPLLSMVKWYGSDGSALNDKLVRNIEAAMFAAKTGFVNPIYGVDNNNSYKFKLIDNQIQKIIGRVPRSYAEVAYDSFWVASLTENSTGGSKDINFLKKSFLKIANSYPGITGDASLNAAGDREHADYDFWAIKANNRTGNSGNSNDQNVYGWGQIGRFQSNSNIRADSTNQIHISKTAIVTPR